jgi:hypothetical protein
MSDVQINIAIAEACGMRGVWEKKITSCGCDGQWDYFNPQGNRLPDYCNDLNAMHEAVRILKSRERITYTDLLHEIAGYHSYDVSEATARQRAEAFLKTINKWEEKP